MKVLDEGKFYAFPLKPESGLRSKFWQQLLCIFEEYTVWPNENKEVI